MIALVGFREYIKVFRRMRMGFSLEVSVPVLTVFLQGFLSFFSPCVLPLLPLYIGYLSGGTGKWEDGKFYYKRSKVMLHTLFFVLGISTAFVTLGLGVSAAGVFLKSNQMLFARVGGILIILFGFYQMGVFGSSALLERERRLPFRLDRLAMSPPAAFLMGFTFSFAWTPCVGPALASVLLMAASAGTRLAGMGLICVYTLGFVLPFLATGMFATGLLGFMKKHGSVARYTVKIGGLLMIFMGLLMFTGKMNAVTGYLSQASLPRQTDAGQRTDAVAGNGQGTETVAGGGAGQGTDAVSGAGKQENGTDSMVKNDNQETSSVPESETDEETSHEEYASVAAPDFTLKDQYGTTHSLSEYEGKTIFLNFWATWCPPCKAELPDIQRLYEAYQGETEEELVVLGVAAPLMGQEKTEEEIIAFLEENGYTYPVLMDTEWELFESYGIYSFPTTFMIDREGNVFGYVSGQITYEIMEDIVRQTMEGRRDRQNS